MAANIRGELVVKPGHTAEYDRITRTHPFGLIVAGVIVWIAGTFTAIAIHQDGGQLVALLVLATGVGGLLAWRGGVLAYRNDFAKSDLTRELYALRAVAVFDEDAVSDTNMWSAAGLADERQSLEWRVEELTQASVRSDQYEQELTEKSGQMHDLTARISTLVL